MRNNNDDPKNDSIYYVYKDHLGSISSITDKTGAIKDLRSYDAFGRQRDPGDWTSHKFDAAKYKVGSVTDRGYCGHEHITTFDLINMNGRLYDPWAGSMLSPDMVMQDPENPQNYNRYAVPRYPSGWPYGNVVH